MAKRLLEYITVFVCGALAYGACEVISRGGTHISMGLLGGMSMIFIDRLNVLRRNGAFPSVLIMLSASIFITAIEFISGVILNLRLNLGIWDYSEMPLNFAGQICAPFTVLWFGLAFVGILFDDWIREKLFDEPKPIRKPLQIEQRA